MVAGKVFLQQWNSLEDDDGFFIPGQDVAKILEDHRPIRRRFRSPLKRARVLLPQAHVVGAALAAWLLTRVWISAF